MTDEKDVVLPKPDELLIGDEVEGQAGDEVEVVQTSPEEERAKAGGWVPKEEWKGNPNDWRPAKEFNERGEFFAHIKDLRNQTAEFKRALQFLTGQQQKQYEKGFQAAIADLKAQRNAALADGEHVVAANIADELVQVQKNKDLFEQSTRPSGQPNEPTEVFKTWHQRNPWYFGQGEDNRTLTLFANTMGMDYRQSTPGGGDEAGMLAYVEKKVKEEFGHKFKQKGPPSPNGEGRQASSRAPQGTGKYSSVKAEMSDENRSIMKTIMRDTGLSEAEYLKMYSE